MPVIRMAPSRALILSCLAFNTECDEALVGCTSVGWAVKASYRVECTFTGTESTKEDYAPAI